MGAIPAERLETRWPPPYGRFAETSQGNLYYGLQKRVFDLGWDNLDVIAMERRPVYPWMWLGGLRGSVQIVSPDKSDDVYSLAQMWGDGRDKLFRALETGSDMQVLVHDWNIGGFWGGYRQDTIKPQPFDLAITEALLHGGLAASRHFSRLLHSAEAIAHLEMLLAAPPKAVTAEESFILSYRYDRPPDDAIEGVVVVLYTTIGGRRFIYVQEETVAKTQWDKQPGDYGPPAGGRQPRESIRDTAYRELYEETSLTSSDVAITRLPIGFFYFPPLNGYHQPRWVAAFAAEVDPYTLYTKAIHPTDGETAKPIWSLPGDYVRKFRTRGAMQGIVETWMKGETDIIREATPGRHVGSVQVYGPRPESAFMTIL